MRYIFYTIILFVSLLCFFSQTSIAQQVSNPFKLRYHTEQRGGIVYVANSIFTCGSCSAVNEVAPSGTSNNNDQIMNFIDIDNDPQTFNSSSADLNIDECSSISFAGLYWGGGVTPTNKRYNDRTKIKLRTSDNGGYLDLNADEYWDGHCFKDITAILNASQKIGKTFTVANLVVDGSERSVYGGWTIIIVYRNDYMPLRDLSVFDGLANVKENSSMGFSVSGFSTPPSGAVNVNFGFVAYDGDRGMGGDYLSINGQKVYDAMHNSNNVFNSTISANGSNVLTRQPALNNTLGYDANLIQLDNDKYKYLPCKANSLSIDLKTNSDQYFVGALTTAIDIYNPNFQFVHRYNAPTSPVKAGQTVEIQYRLKNIGNDKSSSVLFTDTLSSLLDYEKGSLQIQINNNSWMNLTDSSGDDWGTFLEKERRLFVRVEQVNPSTEIRIRYRCTVIKDNDLLKCADGKIVKYGWLEYNGSVNSTWRNKISSVPVGSNDDCSLKGPLIIPLETSSILGDTTVRVYCTGTLTSDLSLPLGYALYKSEDVTFQHPLDKLAEPGIYKAYRKLSTGCEYSFNVIARADSVSIYSQPDNIEATVGSGVAFSVGVKGENVSFQWQVNKGTGTWEDIAGATERSLTIPKVTEEMDGYNYRLRVTTPCKDYLLSVKVVLSVKKQPVSKPSEEPEPQPEVKDQNVGALFVPNAFMPASNTQELRSFVVKGHGLAKWQMTIFNKWDQVIWKTDLIGTDGSPAEGWDGTMFGSDAPQGAYMWAIEAVFEDGKEWEGMSVRDSKPRKSGVVYLLR